MRVYVGWCTFPSFKRVDTAFLRPYESPERPEATGRTAAVPGVPTREIGVRLVDLLKRSETTPPAVVVGNDDVALSVVRDLGAEGVPVVVVGEDRRGIAFRSRYCVARRSADPARDDHRLVEQLQELASALPQRGVLIPADDGASFAVSRHKTALERQFAVPVLAWEHMRELHDKQSQLAAASRAGLQIPKSALLATPEDLDRSAEVPFPVLLKPVRSGVRFPEHPFKVVVIENRTRLGEAYERFRALGPFLLQELISGKDDEVYIAGASHDAQSRCLALFTGRKLRQHPRGFGVARVCESRWSPTIADLALRLLAELHYQGVCDVEFRHDPRDGLYKFMELNPRPGYWVSLARACGVNLTYIAYRDALGLPLPEHRQRDEVVWADFLHDLPDSVRELRRGDLRLSEWLAPLAKVRVAAYLSWRDVRPGLYEIGAMTRAHSKAGLGRLLAGGAVG
jgi:predicted ATP-grasp superfamily ATP-dependent carboligase